jgi:hypothetical protein
MKLPAGGLSTKITCVRRARELHELLYMPYMPYMPTDGPTFNVTHSRLGRLVRQGFLTRPGRGRYQKRTQHPLSRSKPLRPSVAGGRAKIQRSDKRTLKDRYVRDFPGGRGRAAAFFRPARP